MSDTTITGNLTDDPTLKFLPDGTAICEFTIAKNRGKDEDKKVSYIDVTCWRQLAENVAESLTKGDRAFVTGNLDQDRWEDKETGDKRSKLKVTAFDAGPSLSWATAQVTRNQRES